jgi:hypothetical protein
MPAVAVEVEILVVELVELVVEELVVELHLLQMEPQGLQTLAVVVEELAELRRLMQPMVVQGS